MNGDTRFHAHFRLRSIKSRLCGILHSTHGKTQNNFFTFREFEHTLVYTPIADAWKCLQKSSLSRHLFRWPSHPGASKSAEFQLFPSALIAAEKPIDP